MSVMPILYMRLAYEGGDASRGGMGIVSACASRARRGGARERVARVPPWRRARGVGRMRAARGDARGFAPDTPA